MAQLQNQNSQSMAPWGEEENAAILGGTRLELRLVLAKAPIEESNAPNPKRIVCWQAQPSPTSECRLRNCQHYSIESYRMPILAIYLMILNKFHSKSGKSSQYPTN